MLSLIHYRKLISHCGLTIFFLFFFTTVYFAFDLHIFLSKFWLFVLLFSTYCEASRHSKYQKFVLQSSCPQLKASVTVEACGRVSQNSWGRLLSDSKVTLKAEGRQEDFLGEEQPEEQKTLRVV